MSRHTVEQYSRVGRAPTAPLPLAKPDAPSQQNESHDRHSRADRGFMLNVFCQLRTCRGCSTSITNVRVSAAGFIATTCRGRHCENGGNNEGCEDRRSGDFLCQGHDRSPFDHWFHYVFASLSRTPGTDAMSGLWSIARISDVAFVTSGGWRPIPAKFALSDSARSSGGGVHSLAWENSDAAQRHFATHPATGCGGLWEESCRPAFGTWQASCPLGPNVRSNVCF